MHDTLILKKSLIFLLTPNLPLSLSLSISLFILFFSFSCLSFLFLSFQLTYRRLNLRVVLREGHYTVELYFRSI